MSPASPGTHESRDDRTPDQVLELRGVRRLYGSLAAVDDVDLTVADGEFVTFLGPSGSGKTTTLMMVAGLQRPTSGDILLRGKSLGRLPPYRRNIGMVFQQYALFPHMTAGANVAFPLEMRGLSREEIRRRVDEALALVGLPDHGGRYPAQLSGGQQQRVALARAIVFRPPILLMDEPLGALDKKLRVQMQAEISRLHRELGISVLYVTHDQEEALVMSDRIAVFNKGRIEQIGKPKDLYERPKTGFVADFLGESSFIPGVVRTTDGDFALVASSAGMLWGYNTGGLSEGDEAVVAIRPERVQLGPPADSQANVVEGVIRDLIYLGQSRKLTIQLADGNALGALQQAPSFGETEAKPGDRVTAKWARAECNVLRARS